MKPISVTSLKSKYKDIIREDIDKEFVLDAIIKDGQMTARFIFFAITASAIATLGLLLNSPAVIIGAMLISPLMGPIVLQGFSISLIDINLYKKSLVSVVIGTTLGILTSYIIVKLSPITNISSEILARTSPNLFDLLVAIFSGTAASYVSIKQKGTAIVGAAIATSLMPPLAVVGYGLATSNFWISQGAFFLYLTNFVAIALAVVFVAIFYGFFRFKKAKYLYAQIIISLCVLLIMSVPLAIALKNIAYQSYVIAEAKNVIMTHFTHRLDRLNDFKINFDDDHKIDIDAVVITKTYRPEVKDVIQKELNDITASTINLSLTQIALTGNLEVPAYLKNLQTKNNLTNAGAYSLSKSDSSTEIQQQIIKQLWFPFQLVSVDQDSGMITVFASYDPDVSLNNFRQQEVTLAKQFPDWIIRILPSWQKIPSIHFNRHMDELTADIMKTLDNITWALERWQIKGVIITAQQKNAVKDNKVKIENEQALTRANLVVQYLESKGFIVDLVTNKGNFETKDLNRIGIELKEKADQKNENV